MLTSERNHSQDYERLSEAVKPFGDCWADFPFGAVFLTCPRPAEGELGLCSEHRAEIIGPTIKEDSTKGTK